MRDDVVASIRFVWYFVLAAVLVTGVCYAGYWMQSGWLAMERQNFKASHQYIEGRRDLLLKLAAEYDENETEIARFTARGGDGDVLRGLVNQRESLKARIRAEAANIPEDEVPASARRIK